MCVCVCVVRVSRSILMIVFRSPGFDCVLGLSIFKHQSSCFCSFFDCKKVAALILVKVSKFSIFPAPAAYQTN